MRMKGRKELINIEKDMNVLLRLLEKTDYAIIGGMAIVFCVDETRYTKDIDVAMKSLGDLPPRRLIGAGFSRMRGAPGDFARKWKGPHGTPVDFSDSDDFEDAVEDATLLSVGLGRQVRVASPVDLLRLKIKSGSHPSRDPMKRLQDRSDALRIVDEDPDLEREISEEGRKTLASWRAS